MPLPHPVGRAVLACALALVGPPAQGASARLDLTPPAVTAPARPRAAGVALVRGPDLWSSPMLTLDRATFFDGMRAGLFNGHLAQSQVAGLDLALDACPADLGTDALAYCLATDFHETAHTMQPIEEYGRGQGKKYGASGFYGRGLVQLTWDYNYAKATTELRRRGILKADEDLVKTPALALRPDVATAVLFYGMVEGWFTGRKLGDYFAPGRSDPQGARAIINGSDRAALIAGYFRIVRDALRAAGHAPVAAAKPAPSSAVLVPQPAAPASQPGFWARVHAALSRTPRSA